MRVPSSQVPGSRRYRRSADDDVDLLLRRLLLAVFAGALALAACGGDDGESDDGVDPSTTTTSAPDDATTTTTEAPPVDSTFVPEDVEALCADLEGLADIDPDADPTQAQVDRLLAIAEHRPVRGGRAPGGRGRLRPARGGRQHRSVDALPDNAEEHPGRRRRGGDAPHCLRQRGLPDRRPPLRHPRRRLTHPDSFRSARRGR